MRIFALSDIHVDFPDNAQWVSSLSAVDYQQDALLLAGDVTHSLPHLAELLASLKAKFAQIFFVPGNHDLWLTGSGHADSLSKLSCILDTCAGLGVQITAAKLGDADRAPVWIVPLHSFYDKPEQSPSDSLYVYRPGEDPDLQAWMDAHEIRWPRAAAERGRPAAHLLGLNDQVMDSPLLGGQIISMSHFLPRRELMYPTPAELAAWPPGLKDRSPWFNFSRVAGSLALERQIRALGSTVHIYGHQHRNRQLVLDGVRYLSYCLGYPRERQLLGVTDEPKLVWDTTGAPISEHGSTHQPQRPQPRGAAV